LLAPDRSADASPLGLATPTDQRHLGQASRPKVNGYDIMTHDPSLMGPGLQLQPELEGLKALGPSIAARPI